MESDGIQSNKRPQPKFISVSLQPRVKGTVQLQVCKKNFKFERRRCCQFPVLQKPTPPMLTLSTLPLPRPQPSSYSSHLSHFIFGNRNINLIFKSIRSNTLSELPRFHIFCLCCPVAGWIALTVYKLMLAFFFSNEKRKYADTSLHDFHFHGCSFYICLVSLNLVCFWNLVNIVVFSKLTWMWFHAYQEKLSSVEQTTHSSRLCRHLEDFFPTEYCFTDIIL